MKRSLPLLAAACLTLMYCPGTVPSFAAEAQLPVLAQDLKKLRVPEKVGAVLWTRRVDQYTLQVVFPNRQRILIPLLDGRRLVAQPAQPALPVSAPALTEVMKQDLQRAHGRNPQVQAWFLKADGTLVAARAREPIAEKSSRSVSNEALYSIPLAQGREAVAVALMVDNEYYIERLQPLGN